MPSIEPANLAKGTSLDYDNFANKPKGEGPEKNKPFDEAYDIDDGSSSDVSSEPCVFDEGVPSVDDAANAAELGTASDPEPDNANVANKKKKKNKNKKNKNKKKSVARANDLDAKV